MAADWKVARLADLVDIKHGFAFDGAYFRDEQPGDILLTPGNFAVGGGFKDDKIKYYSGPVPSDFILDPGDLLVTMTDLSKNGDTLGLPALIPSLPKQRFLHNQRLGKVIVRKSAPLVKRFLYYTFCSQPYRNEVLASATGTTVKHTSPSRIAAFSLPLPPVEEQAAIAHILGTLDDKIELNRRMNETLEAITRAIFKSWFVDFDPVRTKAEERQPVGVDAETVQLFPDRLVESEFGLVPAGWRIGSPLEAASLISGGTPRTSEVAYWGGGIRWASAKDISQCTDAFLLETERTITEEGLANSATTIVPRFSSVVVARGATTGRLTMLGEDMGMNQTCYALRSKHDAHLYLFHLLRHTIASLVHAAHGSVFDTITTTTFVVSRVLLPPAEVCEQFEALAAPIYEKVLQNLRESRILAAIRDALLPKLLSGEIRVQDAAKLVGAAT